MFKKLSISAAALAAVGFAGAAVAAPTETFTINAEIAAFATIETGSNGTVLNLTPNSLNTDDSNEGDGPVLPFTVNANAGYQIEAVFDTFQPAGVNGTSGGAPTYEQAKFENGTDVIGGSVFLYRGSFTGNNCGVVRQNGNGDLILSPTTFTGSHGQSGTCLPQSQLEVSNGGPDLWNIGANLAAQYSQSADGSVLYADPPAGTYTLSVDVTVTPIP